MLNFFAPFFPLRFIYSTKNSVMLATSIKINKREHNSWVTFVWPLYESTVINVISSEERSNNRAVWLLLLPVTFKATTECLTCWLWERASIHWHRWQKYSICMHLYLSQGKIGEGADREKWLRRRWKENWMCTSS